MTAQKRIYFILMALLVMFGLVAATFQPAAAAEVAVSCKQWHTVERGEYLVKIARLYDTDWRTLAEINDLQNPSLIYPGQKLCASLTSSGSSAPVIIPVTGSGVRVYAQSVQEDEYASLRGRNLVANARYSVYMSKYGAYTTSAFVVGSVFTDKNGAFAKTFYLPKKLADVSKIYVQISNGRGDVASNWFINATAEGNTGGVGAPALSFSVLSHKEDELVKIKTSNLPANVSFDVRMGKAGSKGADGILVGTLWDEDGGAVKASFDIPSELQGRSKIDLRLENKALGIYAYLTFEN